MRLFLFCEQLSVALWPAISLVGLFLGLALLDLLPALPGWLHASLLVGFAAGLVFALWRGTRALRWPRAEEASRRLELDSGIAHRPLSALDDTLVSGTNDPASLGLWQEHRRRLQAKLAALGLRPPRPVMAIVDPLALRGAVGLLLVIGLVVGYSDWPGRLAAAFQPRLIAGAADLPPSLDIWINPPTYTGLPPQFLDPAKSDDSAITVPVGSEVLAQVQGGNVAPLLYLGAVELPFEAFGEEAYRVSGTIEATGELRIGQAQKTLAAWRLEVLPDDPPRVEFLSPPGRTSRSILRLEYGAEDDYGLDQVLARIQRIDKPEVAPIELELPLPGQSVKRAENASYHDLTPHPWAGIAVEIQLVAKDALGQIGESDPVRTLLPERIFNHPVARALVELRKQLTLEPEVRLPVVRRLSELFDRPSHFFDDIVVALALRSAERRLIHDRRPEAVTQVQQLLWDTALRIEEGELAISERDLRDIQDRLMQALNEGAPDEEIERLMDELQQALDRFLEALAEQMREQLAEGGEPEALPPDAQLLEGSELQRMIDEARQLAQSGARDAARDLLARLQEMLENLQANPFAQNLNQDGQNAFKMMRDLDQLTRRQQELLDRSYRRSQQGNQQRQGQGQERQGEGQNQSENQGDMRTQESLRRQLGKMMRELGDALGDLPRSFGRAERAMRDARDALARNQPGDAVDPQTRALDQLQQGMQEAAEAFIQQFGTAQGRGQGTVGMNPGQGRDPLGRETGEGGLEAIEGVKIPDQMERRRAREILNELRRRRSQQFRAPLELDYIDRLLQQF